MKAPHILLILTDQHNAGYLGCLGHPVLRTPHLDALAAQSNVFTSAYSASPVCGPARAALFSGRHPLANGVCTNWVPIRDKTSLLTRRLAGAGYYNAMIGKLHLSPVGAPHGFHHRRMCDGPHDVYDRDEVVHNDYLPWAATELGLSVARLVELAGASERCGAEDPRFWLGWDWTDDAHQMTTWTGNEAAAFLRDYDRPQPFFLHVSFFGPHHPYSTCEPWDSLYAPDAVPLPPTLRATPPPSARGCRFDWPEARWREVIARYLGNLAAIDAQVGRLLATLRSRGWWDDTLVVFTADHGDHIGDFAMLGKGTLLESSVRVPCLIKPPRPAPVSRVRREVVNLIDLHPTLLDYAGAGPAPHPRSLRRLLEGETAAWENRTFASLCTPDGRNGRVMHVREDRKAVGILKDGALSLELYDRTDPVPDLRDRAGDPAWAPIADEMRVALEGWLAGGCP